MFRLLKRLMPTTLFGRALLILVLPVLLVQIVAYYAFYERHWESVTRQMSSALAGEVAWLVDRWEGAKTTVARKRLLAQSEHYMGFAVTALPPMQMEVDAASEPYAFPKLESLLKNRIDRPFALRHQDEAQKIFLLVPVEEAMLQIEIPEKRLVSPTTSIFIFWMGGASLGLLLIAVLFLRNQIRPIVQLAEAAERFGKGQDTQQFRPSGAKEVRQAGKAFLEMRERIRRQVESRTAMLAGISHDLRTPLTRMKLELAMQDSAAFSKELHQDVTEMEHMIEAYLAFARGEGSEAAERISVQSWLEEVVQPYLRSEQPVTLSTTPEAEIKLKPKAMKRVMQNLIDNALRYGKQCWVSAELRRHKLILVVEDNGPGIPEADREQVFHAFKRLEASRNSDTGGAGLGLTIVRDIVHAHGGQVNLETSPQHQGLLVRISVPV
jgi:two-component system osmolarity sensor histidine kinase EnvZ